MWCSAVQCSAVQHKAVCLSVPSRPDLLQVGCCWHLLSSCAYFVARFQVLPGLVSGVSHAGSSTFAAPWHWNATLRLHNCNLILPARLVPVNCIVATHARHFVCIDSQHHPTPCPGLTPDRTSHYRRNIGDDRQTVLGTYPRGTQAQTPTQLLRIQARPFGQSSLTHQGMLYTLAGTPMNPCELQEWIDSALGQSQTPLARR